MKLFTYTCSARTSLPSCFAGEQDVFFDIETTGLDWRRSHVYLIAAGIFRPDSGLFEITQWFADEPSREADLLGAFAEFLKPFKRLIHYNGNGFDLPYLQRKYALYRFPSPLDPLDTLDLYQTFRPFRGLFRLSSLKLKVLETFAGFQRKDTCNGAELIEIYHQYLAGADPGLLNILCLHNLEDITGLLHILSLYGFPSLLHGSFRISEVQTDSSCLIITVTPETGSLADICFSGSLGTLRSDRRQMTLKIKGEQRELKYFYENYRDYYYLPLEDTAIHKSVGAYVDSAHREKAKAANCYQRRSGLFFPQPSEIITPAFRESYRPKKLYFEQKDLLQKDPDLLKKYIVSVVSYFCTEAASLSDSSPSDRK